MRIIRFEDPVGRAPVWGWIDGARVGRLYGAPYGELAAGAAELSRDAIQLLAPVCPGKIIGVGRNYPAHAAEHQADVPKQPLLFLKPPTAVIGPGEPIVLPPQSEQVEHEGELAVVIGRRGRWIAPDAALGHVLGYTAANDVTARDLQRADPQWTRAKGFDTFCPVGPWVDTGLDPAAVQITATVNGELRQRGEPREMVFSVAELVAYCSSVMTLEPGDLILTGTPAGVGRLADGDEVSVEITGLGVLTNPVVGGPAGQ